MKKSMLEGLTNSAGTKEWREATRDLKISAYIPGELNTLSTTAVSAQPVQPTESELIVVPLPALPLP